MCSDATSRAICPSRGIPHVSRQHARLRVADDHLDVERIASARNPILYDGNESDHFLLKDGEHFVIGATMLSFARTADSASSVGPVEEVTFEPQELQKIRFRDADRRFDVLTRLHEVIWGHAPTASSISGWPA